MRIVSWNCNGAFRNKYEHIASFDADIYVIQECENPALSKHPSFQAWAKNYLWIGDDKNRGVGIFAKEEIVIQKLDWTNNYQDHSVKYFLPCRVNNQFDLLAVWAHQNKSPNFGYIGQFWKYLQVNLDQLNDVIIAGDFNSNTRWDQWDRWWNHSDVIKILKTKNIESVYHSIFKEAQGEEKMDTFFLQRNLQKHYHIDYFFASKVILDRITHFQIEENPDWLTVSDHRPLIADLF